METYQNNISIKQWAEDDRPREKMLLKGKNALSDAELLAILLGTGTKGESAVELAKRILKHCSENLLELSRYNAGDFTRNFKGVGHAKAISLIAALELGNRKRASEALQRQKISSSRDAFEYLRSFMSDSQYEEFWILILNRANKILHRVCVSEGGVSGTVADPKKIFKIALDHNGASIILSHNHPSGCTTPSDTDKQLTRKLRDAGNILDLPVIDHIIVGEENYYSFADEGWI